MATDLIGRERELEQLVDRLQDHRLVTVVGPGGIGKTAVARAVAARQGPRFPLGAHFVDLSRVDEADAVGGALAAQLGFPSFRALVDSPSDQPALLVLDNCEHVLDAAATAIDELLASCDAPTVVATSRSPLDLPDESLVVLGPLPLGSADGEPGAVRLFLDRARDAGAVLDEEDAAVADLCQALDGVPLAVEIAAARTRVLSPSEILDRLDDLDTLARPRFRGSERHRTVRATIAWSYEQLDRPDQALFDRLGVPAASFTAAMAHAVAADPDTAPGTTDRGLEGLVRASLLVTEQDGSTTRYRQLRTVRTFAREQLEARGEDGAVHNRYVDHLVATGTALSRVGRDGWTGGDLTELLALSDHLLAGLRWAVTHDAQPDRAAALLAALWGVIHQGRTDDIGAAGELVLARWPDGTGPRWALAMATVATCRHLQGRAEAAIELAERTVAGVEPDRRPPPTLFRVIGMAKAATGDLDGALAAFTEAEALARQRGVDVLVRETTICRAWVRAEQGATHEALASLRDVALDADAADDGVNAAWARVTEGQVLLGSDPAAATALLAAAVDASRGLNYRAGVVGGLQGHAQAALLRGQPPEAARRLVELVDEVTLGGAVTELRNLLRTAAAVLHHAGDDHWVDLAATAATLPRTSLFSRVGDELFPLPDGGGRVRSVNEAMALARTRLVVVTDGTTAAPPPAALGGAVEEGTFRREGDLWRLAWAGREITVRPSKGIVDLGRLLTEPGREVHCLELAGAGVEQGTTGDVIDETARREYEQRIRDLQAEIDEAEANHDYGSADRAQVEFDTVVEHLAGALGLGGRARRGGSTAERARSAVTHRIRATVRRLADEHPELGRHLAASVTTGVFCCYRPERPVRWRT